MFMRSSHLSVAFAVVALKLAAGPAIAQVQLQGAVGVSGQPIEQGVAVRAPHESSVIGRELRLNGENGHLAFQLKGADFVISKLVLAGEKISARGEACQIEVTGGPFVLRPLRVQGRRLPGICRRFLGACRRFHKRSRHFPERAHPWRVREKRAGQLPRPDGGCR